MYPEIELGHHCAVRIPAVSDTLRGYTIRGTYIGLANNSFFCIRTDKGRLLFIPISSIEYIDITSEEKHGETR